MWCGVLVRLSAQETARPGPDHGSPRSRAHRRQAARSIAWLHWPRRARLFIFTR